MINELVSLPRRRSILAVAFVLAAISSIQPQLRMTAAVILTLVCLGTVLCTRIIAGSKHPLPVHQPVASSLDQASSTPNVAVHGHWRRRLWDRTFAIARGRLDQAPSLTVDTLALLEGSAASIIITDLSGTVLALNSAAKKLIQFSDEDFASDAMVLTHDETTRTTRFIPRKSLLRHRGPVLPSTDLQLAPENSHKRCWSYMRKDGSRAAVHLSVGAFRNPAGEIAGYVETAFEGSDEAISQTIKDIANRDQLTGLPNRLALNSLLISAIADSGSEDRKTAVFIVGLDHFKRVNESLGHSAGDAVLRHVARQLKTAVRRSDIVVRFAGDVFAVIMPNFAGFDDADRCAALIAEVINSPITLGTQEIAVTASVGYCLYPDAANGADELIHRAEIAMQAAKDAERGGCRAFSIEMHNQAVSRIEIENELRQALKKGELSLHYQPQVGCETGEVTGMEMLLRWTSPTRGQISPATFIPIAEKAGLIVAIGEWSLRRACKDAVSLRSQCNKPLTVAVNISPFQLSQPNFITVVLEALCDSGLPADCLEIEITEQLLMTSEAPIMQTLTDLRQLGVKVAIDDFGTGYSSFSYILQYQFDRLKIDRSFIARATCDAGAAAIVRTVIAMAHSLNITVVAEGVETFDQMQFLLRRKCDHLQGFLFSKGVPVSEFADAAHRIVAYCEPHRPARRFAPAVKQTEFAQLS